jgi:hypothetical protein
MRVCCLMDAEFGQEPTKIAICSDPCREINRILSLWNRWLTQSSNEMFCLTTSNLCL